MSEKSNSAVLLSGDLGFGVFEEIQKKLGSRFLNMGVAEQNMISVAAGLARTGFLPICYSIAPFILFRGAEQVRIDLGLHGLNVKLVGNGGGYGYGMMGATHHAIEDLAFASSLQNMSCFIPVSDEDVFQACEFMMARSGPAYLRLGLGRFPKELPLPSFAPIRRILEGGNRLTIVALGPAALPALEAVRELAISVDFFVVSQLPLPLLQEEFVESAQRNRKIFIVEEHVTRGGLAESIALALAERGTSVKIRHFGARGYPSHLSGSQLYHQHQSGIDFQGLFKSIREFFLAS